MSYDAERAAQTLATPKFALADFEPLSPARIPQKQRSGFAIGPRARFSLTHFLTANRPPLRLKMLRDLLSFD
jgi:hypothetical protein